MRHFALLAVCFSCLTGVAVHGEEGLFSEVAMEAVFETTGSPATLSVATKTATGRINRITGVSSLIEVLKEAGWDATERDGRASFQLQHARWNFPVLIAVQVDRDRMDCQMSLVAVKDPASIPSETLLQLLAASNDSGATFAFEPKSKLIQVRTSPSNRSLTAALLKEKLLQMAIHAEKHAESWSQLNGETDPNAKSTAAPSKLASNGGLSLTGRWSASLGSGEAFAIQINDDSSFRLVHLKSGKSTVSQGKTKLSGNQLTLAGDNDLTLNCTVAQSKPERFELSILDANGKVATKLDFKKAP